MDAVLDLTADGRPNFRTTRWRLMAASAQGSAGARATRKGPYRLREPYPALIREVARTVADPAGVEAALRAVYEALIAAGGRPPP